MIPPILEDSFTPKILNIKKVKIDTRN